MPRLASGVFVVLLASIASHGRAEDPPAANNSTLPPRWELGGPGYEIHASSDGKWVGCRETGAVRLYPTDGGKPVTLDCGKGERLGSAFGFSADSNFVCVAGDATPTLVKGRPEARTQSVFLFPVATPVKRRKVNLSLKSDDLEMGFDPRLGIERPSGELREITPFSGSRVIFDRGELGFTLWDLATEGKVAAPPSLDSPLNCGLSADASRCVRWNGRAIEVRDVTSNRVLQTIPTPDYQWVARAASYLAFTRDGACVVLLRRKSEFMKVNGPVPLEECHVDCWSLADGKRVWEASVGKCKRCHGAYVTAAHAVAHLDDRVVVVGLADGKEVQVGLESKKVAELCPSADGKSLWAVLDANSLTRVDLPAAAEK